MGRQVKKAPAYLRRKVTNHVCDLYEENYRAVIFRNMKVKEPKERHAICLDGKAAFIKMPIFFKLIYGLIVVHTQNPSRTFFLL